MWHLSAETAGQKLPVGSSPTDTAPVVTWLLQFNKQTYAYISVDPPSSWLSAEQCSHSAKIQRDGDEGDHRAFEVFQRFISVVDLIAHHPAIHSPFPRLTEARIEVQRPMLQFDATAVEPKFSVYSHTE